MALFLLLPIKGTAQNITNIIMGVAQAQPTLEGSVNGQGQVFVTLAGVDDNNEPLAAPFDVTASNRLSDSEFIETAKKALAGGDPVSTSFTIYAVPYHGYSFVSWKDLTENEDKGRLYDEKVNPALAIAFVKLSVSDITNGNADTNPFRVQANFEKNEAATFLVKYNPANHGSYKVWQFTNATERALLANDGSISYETYPDEYIYVEATPEEGSQLLRYYAQDATGNKTTLGDLGVCKQLIRIPEGTVAVGAEFSGGAYAILDGVPGSFDNFEDAIQALRKKSGNNDVYSGTIVVVKDATLPAGHYVLPKGVTLLIPKDGLQMKAQGDVVERTPEYTTPTCYRTWTLAPEAYLDVFGTIEVGGQQCMVPDETDTRLPYYSGVLTGSYGHMVLSDNSHITLEKDAKLRAWGYVTNGKSFSGNRGDIDVRRGAVVREYFQTLDWPGARKAFDWLSTGKDYRAFLVNQYYIQNVEAPAIYHPGARLISSIGVMANRSYFGIDMKSEDIGVIGCAYGNGQKDEDAIFLMEETDVSKDTWVRKYYDPLQDKQVYEINNAAKLGSVIIINLPIFSMGSPGYVLPLVNNMKIHLLSGKMGITQDVQMLPGMEIEVDKEATVNVERNSSNNETVSIYLCATQDWMTKSPVFGGLTAIEDDNGESTVGYSEAGMLSIIPYSPTSQYTRGDIITALRTAVVEASNENTWTYGVLPLINALPAGAPLYRFVDVVKAFMAYTSASEEMKFNALWNTMSAPTSSFHDATINVHGTLKIGEGGAVYTTHLGANIISSNEDAGTVYFETDVPESTEQKLYYLQSGTVSPSGITCTYAKLHNEDTSTPYTETQGTLTGASYCYKDGQWKRMGVEDCFATETVNKTTTYYAKPAEYVAVNKDPNDDHIYSDAAGEGRSFILIEDDCQWWEVEQEGDHYKCLTPNANGYYPRYKYNKETDKWENPTYTITWKNWEGTKLAEYTLPYGATPKYNSTNPTRPSDVNYDYVFANEWEPAVAPVTADASYTAKYEPKAIKHTVIFRFDEAINGGAEIERQLLAYGETPVIPTVHTASGEVLYVTWSPAVGAVTGPATYVANIVNEKPEVYIYFRDYNGTSLGGQEKFKWSENNKYPSSTVPTRDGTSEYSYTFAGWKSSVMDENGEYKVYGLQELLPEPETDVVYTAQYSQNSYTVKFKNANGSVLQQSKWAVGATPSYTGETPAMDPDAQYNYGAFIDWTPAITAVTGDATYTATYATTPRTYTVKWLDENGNLLETDENVASGVKPTFDGTLPTKDEDDTYTYELVWTPNVVAVDGDATYHASFVPRMKYTITWYKEDGTTELDHVKYSAGAIPEYSGETPTKESQNGITYVFAGWKCTAGSVTTSYSAGTALAAVTGDAAYTAIFTPFTSEQLYTIVWKNGENILETDENVPYRVTPVYDGPTPTKEANAGYTYTFSGWTPTVVAATENATYTALFNQTLVVDKTSKIELMQPTTLNNLVIRSNGIEAGQITGADQITLSGNADFDLTLNAAARTWYAVAVPWRVNAETGIYADGRHLTLGVDFDLIWYDGQIRATQGTVADCWRYVELESDHTMLPGRAYMIYLASPATTLRFRKAGRANLLNTDVQLTATDGNPSDQNANWNGIANPALYSANLTVGTTKAQYYDGDTKTYSVASLDNMIVGKPAFVQVANGASVVVNSASNAPMRRSAQTSVKGEFELTLTNGVRRMDNLFVAIDGDKEADRYTIGSDLLKMGVSTTSAQMWINRYDARLCVNTMAPVDGTADFPLSLYTPAAGDYTITVQSAPVEGMVIYLTRDGHAVWNLSEAPYTFSLNRGTDITYGLRISAAPSVVTSLDEALVEKGATTATKVLINDVIYILREGKVYTINGQVVE